MRGREVSDAELAAVALCLSVVGMVGGAGAVVLSGSAAGWNLFVVSFTAWMAAFVAGFLVVWNRGFVDE